MKNMYIYMLVGVTYISIMIQRSSKHGYARITSTGFEAAGLTEPVASRDAVSQARFL